MIDNPLPNTWQELQTGVNKIFNEIGLTSEVEKNIDTPRGTVEIDVFAEDLNSVDKIKYVVECKNWSSSIPQTVVHSFTTVMHETGGNIGYIISKIGLQKGAREYTKNTNISGLTYEEFQRKYFNVWYQNYFVPSIGDAVDSLSQYVEPINSRRDKEVSKLSSEKQEQFTQLQNQYMAFGIAMAFFEFPRYSPRMAVSTPDDINEIKNRLAKIGKEFRLESYYFRELLTEIIGKVKNTTGQFNQIFGKDIFA
jgi:tetrahydromethanopterin S-methyltransferase subunit G